ncbi:MAG TPA: M48 family metalloprotease, partial [Gammaproteobacteria bacterium]
MDFFSAQDEARKNTKWLVLLFALAVASIIILLYVALVLLTSWSDTARIAAPIQWWQPHLFYIVAGATSGVILLGSLYKTLLLARGGGAAVAESLGGRLVSRGTGDALERRLLNVVDEMAIAAGIPVPRVYILDEESSINAFAAGYDVQNAVVAVTRGCLEQLSRDELQGVVGHEFSHIFNGDMRINLRLIGILHGILLLAIAGRVVLRGGGRGRSRNAGAVVAAGLALLVVGYAGLFFGRAIKAAVSRQREFLADASAVQFTRNPSGISGALKKIGGLSNHSLI